MVTSAESLLLAGRENAPTEVKVGASRAQLFQFQGVPLVVTYHPAYLLRNPSAKRDVWADMQRVREILNTPRG